MVSTLEQMQVPNGTGPGVRRSKRQDSDKNHKGSLESKSKKYRGVFNVKSQVNTRQCREIWSHQLENKQVPKRGTGPGVRKGERSLLACHT